MDFLATFLMPLIPLVLAAALGLIPVVVSAQQVPANTPNKAGVAAGGKTVLSAPVWSELSSLQQQSLAPLVGTWNSLPEVQRRKWLVLAQNYPNLAPAEQQKLHSRMAEWAALKPKDREQARLNFAETKKIAPSDLTGNWEAYQALSPEERKKLAADAKPKTPGAATAVKPVPAEKLAEVPKATTKPDTKRQLVTKPESLNRSTLLPTVEIKGSPRPDAPQN